MEKNIINDKLKRVKHKESLTSLLCQANHKHLSISFIFLLLLKQSHSLQPKCQIRLTGEELRLRSETEAGASGWDGRLPDAFLIRTVQNRLIRSLSEASPVRVSIAVATETVLACADPRRWVAYRRKNLVRSSTCQGFALRLWLLLRRCWAYLRHRLNFRPIKRLDSVSLHFLLTIFSSFTTFRQDFSL